MTTSPAGRGPVAGRTCRITAFALMGILDGAPAVAYWQEGQPLVCDQELALVARAMVAAGVSVSSEGHLADLDGPPEIAALTLSGALSELTTATVDVALSPVASGTRLRSAASE